MTNQLHTLKASQIGERLNLLRASLGLTELANPAKLGKAKLIKIIEDLEPQVEDSSELFAFESSLSSHMRILLGKKFSDEDTIKHIACSLLEEVVAHDDKGREIGASYKDVLQAVLANRPEAQTSVNSLRWYAGKIRVSDKDHMAYSVPQIRARG